MAKHEIAGAASKPELVLVQQMLGLLPSAGSKQFIEDAVFVCIDCEAFEHAQKKITEVGIAVLDTRDVADLHRDDDEQKWFFRMKYAHYRPVEYASLRNKTHITGCPEKFSFGPSTWVKRTDLRTILQRVFRYPTQLQQAAHLDVGLSDADRNVVFVAHGATNDTAYLKQVGFDLSAGANIARTCDTQKIAGSKKRPVSLQRLLLSLGHEGVNLHNAGNDAAYTLQSLVVMALREFKAPGSVAAGLVKYAGKLRPAEMNSRVAPVVWAGTATRPDGVGIAAAKAVKAVPAPTNKATRRDRKRAARKVAGASSEVDGVSKPQAQRPLPGLSQ